MVHSNILTTPDGKTPAFGPPHWVAGAIGNSTWSGRGYVMSWGQYWHRGRGCLLSNKWITFPLFLLFPLQSRGHGGGQDQYPWGGASSQGSVGRSAGLRSGRGRYTVMQISTLSAVCNITYKSPTDRSATSTAAPSPSTRPSTPSATWFWRTRWTGSRYRGR